MGKTIKQIAEELGISKQSIYKRIKGSLNLVCAPYVHTVNGVLHIEYEGEMLIKSAFSEKTVSNGVYTYEHTDRIQDTHINHNKLHDENTQFHIVIDTLKNQLQIKDDQILILQQQFEEKDKQIAMLQKLIDQQQQLQLADKVHSNPLLEITDKKRGWKFWNKKQI